MSYILDALRRADAERERGAVPGLQSQQHTIAPDDEVASPPRSRSLLWLVAGLGVALVATIAWALLGGRGAAPPAAAHVSEGAVAPPANAPVLLPTSPAAPSVSLPPTTPAAAPALLPTAPSATTATATATATPSTPAVTAPPAATERPARSVAAATPRPPRTAANEPRRTAPRGDDAATGGNARVVSQGELPEEIRRELPRLAIGGASYSGDAASRMVMINGQVFHEGDQLAPGLVLERIKLKSAVLAYKGYRYEVTF